LKRGHYVLIAGGAIFVAGLVLTVAWALPLAAEIQKGTTILQGRDVAVGESVTITLGVADTTKPLSVVISAGAELEMNARVLDPEGEQIFTALFTEAMAEATEPTVPGVYELVITNQSPSDAAVDVVFGQIPGVGEQNVDTEVFSGILAGLAIIIAGIMVLIGGVVVAVVDRRR
jgi:phosphoribosylformylglycinamidine (FGAM) synthase PurS component